MHACLVLMKHKVHQNVPISSIKIYKENRIKKNLRARFISSFFCIEIQKLNKNKEKKKEKKRNKEQEQCKLVNGQEE